MIAWEELLVECQRLEEAASKIQQAETVELSTAEIKKISDDYQSWFGKCLAVLPEDLRGKFREEYEGSFWSAKIKKFFEAATEPSLFRPTDEQTRAIFPHWAYPYKQNFYPYIESQRLILIEASERKQHTNSEGKDLSWNETVRRIFKVFIEKADKASTSNEKKLTYEYLAIFLVGSVDGLSILGHDERGVSEEIDVWVANESDHVFWKKMPPAFIVECKNWGDPVGVPQLRSLRAVMDDKNISLAILMTRNGITGDRNHDAGDIVRNAFRDNKYILVLTEADLLEMSNGTSPTEKIRQKYFDLHMKS